MTLPPLDEPEGFWAVTYEDDCGNPMDRPRVFQLANPDELRAFIANRRHEGDATCAELADSEARALTLADVYSYDNLSDA